MTVNEPEFLREKSKRDETIGLSPGSIALIIGVMAVVAVFAVQLFRQNQIQPMPGETAPGFSMTTFDGDAVSLEDYRGQIVVVNFWGSWCGPCRAEAPDLQDIYADYQDEGVVVFGVNWLDVDDEALAFLDEFGITYPNAPDVSETVANAYNIEGAPETFIVGRDGIVRESYLGPISYTVLSSRLDALLREGSNS